MTANSQPAIQAPPSDWSLWFHQVLSILRLEMKKNFLSRRAAMIYLLAVAPVLLWAALVTFDSGARRDFSQNFGEAQRIFANYIYEGLILRTAVFFGCAWTFMNLFRGEMVDKSLHYYFLAPVRREVLVAGKYFSGLVTTIILFGASTVASLFFLYVAKGYPSNVEYLVNGPGLKQSLTYLSMTVLACIGYGAIFMAIGLVFRNLIVTLILALVFYWLEWLNFLLPPLLKKISIIHYIHSLAPVPIDEGPLAIIGEPTPWWVAVPGMLIITALVLIAASTRTRRMEIHYGGE